MEQWPRAGTPHDTLAPSIEKRSPGCGVILFLLPIVLLILGLAFAAYFLAG
jgi:hypothetical protein